MKKITLVNSDVNWWNTIYVCSLSEQTVLIWHEELKQRVCTESCSTTRSWCQTAPTRTAALITINCPPCVLLALLTGHFCWDEPLNQPRPHRDCLDLSIAFNLKGNWWPFTDPASFNWDCESIDCKWPGESWITAWLAFTRPLAPASRRSSMSPRLEHFSGHLTRESLVTSCVNRKHVFQQENDSSSGKCTLVTQGYNISFVSDIEMMWKHVT